MSVDITILIWVLDISRQNLDIFLHTKCIQNNCYSRCTRYSLTHWMMSLMVCSGDDDATCHLSIVSINRWKNVSDDEMYFTIKNVMPVWLYYYYQASTSWFGHSWQFSGLFWYAQPSSQIWSFKGVFCIKSREEN